MSGPALERIGQLRILPVAVIDDRSLAAPLGRALVDGGMPLVEVTFRTPDAEAALAELAGNADLVVGAGTVISAAQVDRAVDAGAAFIVSPGLDAEVVAQARARSVAVIPGVATATEIQRALAMGVSTVKLFPAGPLGGPAMITALSGPFPAVRFVPTGGIAAADLTAYLSLPTVIAVGGSWLVAPALLRDKRWEAVTQLARDARQAAL